MDNKKCNLWSWGFTAGAENWNGRLAILGLLALYITELCTGSSIPTFLGFT